jgi:Tol biopolymer transport system component
MRSTKLIAIVATAIAVSTAAPAQGAANASSGKIVFEGDGGGSWGLSVMRPDGSAVIRLHSAPDAADGSWSPNGKQVAFEKEVEPGNVEVFVMNADGTDVRRLTDSPGPDVWPDWFPDGRRIAFTSFRSGPPNIYAMNADGSGVEALTNETDTGSLQPSVSSTGQRIVFQRSKEFEPPAIWVMNADGSGQEPVTEPAGYVNVDPQFSPDGRRIVFASNRLGGFEIFLMNADGSNQVALTGSPGADFNPTFSPDGRSIAWWKLRGGTGDIWVMDADGTSETNVTNTPSTFEGFPDWAPGHLDS